MELQGNYMEGSIVGYLSCKGEEDGRRRNGQKRLRELLCKKGFPSCIGWGGMGGDCYKKFPLPPLCTSYAIYRQGIRLLAWRTK